MKTKHVLLLVVASLFFVACSKDKKDEPKVNNAKVIEGVYNGSMVMTVMEPSEPMDAKIQLKADGDNTVTVITPESGSGHMKMNTMTLKQIKVTTADNKTYKLEETKINELINDMKYVGSISGTIDANGKATIDYSVKPGKMPMSVKFAFTGEKEKK